MNEPGRDILAEPVLAAVALAALQEGVVLLDAAGEFVWANEAAARITGLPHRELVASSIVDLRWTARIEDGSPVPDEQHPVSVALRTGEPQFGIVLDVPRGDGERVWVSVNAQPITRPGQQAPFCVVVSFVDITSERAALRAAERERDHVAALVAALQDGVVETDLEGTIVCVNDRFLEMTGFTRDDLVGGRRPHRFVPEAFHEQYLAAVPTPLDSVSAATRALLCREDGSQFPVSVSVSQVRGAGGQPVGLLGIFRDRTEEVEALRARAEVEARYRALVQHSSDVIVVVDGHGVMDYVSPSAERVLGYHEGERLGEPIFELVHPDDRPLAVESFVHTLATPGVKQPIELRVTRADGTWIEVEVIATNLLADPVVRGVVVTVRDITERRRAEAALRERELALAALEAQREREHLADELHRAQRLESLGRLAGGVAHDFNNLLAVIANHVAFVARHLEPEDPLHTDLGQVRDATHQAAELTRQLLLLGRRDPGEHARLDPDAIVGAVVALMGRPLGDQLRLAPTGGAAGWQVAAPPGAIDQVLVNLLLNARDAVPEGGIAAIRTAVVQLGSAPGAVGDLEPGWYVTIAVCDTGTGMRPDVRDRVFEPFFTTKARGQGTGLGLATAYGIVESLGGTILVESELGSGTTVTVYLPAFPAVGEPEPDDSAPVPSPRRARILLVDDAADVRITTRCMLEQAGYVVVEACDGPRALEHLAAEPPPALLLTDVVMPGMSGPELAARAVQLRPGLATCFLSGDAQVGSHDLDGPLVVKPFDEAELLRAVRAALYGADAQR